MPQDGRLFPSSPEVGTINEGRSTTSFVPRSLDRAQETRESVAPENRFKTGFEPLTAEETAEDNISIVVGSLFKGLGLMNFAAPNQRLREEARKRRKAQLEQLSLTLSAVRTISDVIEKSPADKRQEVIDAAGEKFGEAIPGFKDILQRAAEVPDVNLVADLFGDVENAETVISLTDGDRDAIIELAKDEGFVANLQNRTDQRNLPIAAQKVADAREILASQLGEERLAAIDLSFGDLLRVNERLPDALKLTDSELSTLKRNPNVLLDFGITPPDIQEAAAETRAKETTELEKLQNQRDEAKRAGDTQRVGELDARIGKLTTIVGRTAEDVAGKTTAREEAKARVKAGEDVQLKSFEITNLSSLIGKARKLGENATGLRGVIQEGVGGFLGQINPELEESFASLLGSATPEEIQSFRTQARTTIAQNITTVSGEESGRFTEMERRVTESTLRVLEAGASKTQIVAALSELLKLKVMLKEFSFSKLNVKPKFNLETREGIGSFIEDARKLGLSDDDAVDMARRVRQLRREVKPNIGGGGG